MIVGNESVADVRSSLLRLSFSISNSSNLLSSLESLWGESLVGLAVDVFFLVWGELISVLWI